MINEIVEDLVDGLKKRFDRDRDELLELRKRLEAVEKFVEASKVGREIQKETDSPTTDLKIQNDGESFIVRFVGYENDMDYDDGFRHRKIAKSFKTFGTASNFMTNIRNEYRVVEGPKLFRVIETELVP